MRARVVAMYLLTAASAGAWAQSDVPVIKPRATDTVALPVSGSAVRTAARMSAPATVKPYIMVQTMTTTVIYSNGMTVTQTSRQTNMRDSLGRTRRETENPPVPPVTFDTDGRKYTGTTREAMHMVFITDPVAQVSLSWTTGTISNQVRLAPLNAQVPFPRGDAPPGVSTDALVVKRHTERLGERSIQGVPAKGLRTVTTYPAGYQGANQSYEEVLEAWTANDLGVPIEMTVESPVFGKRVTTLESFSNVEPDVALFKAPADLPLVKDAKVEAPTDKP